MKKETFCLFEKGYHAILYAKTIMNTIKLKWCGTWSAFGSEDIWYWDVELLFLLDLLYLLMIFPQMIIQLVVSHSLADYIDPLQVLVLVLQAYRVIQTWLVLRRLFTLPSTSLITLYQLWIQEAWNLPQQSDSSECAKDLQSWNCSKLRILEQLLYYCYIFYSFRNSFGELQCFLGDPKPLTMLLWLTSCRSINRLNCRPKKKFLKQQLFIIIYSQLVLMYFRTNHNRKLYFLKNTW